MVLNGASLVSLSIGLSILASLIIIRVAAWLFRKGKRGYSFIDLARDADGWPSLARFQFLSWTLVIIFSFTTVALVRLFDGVLDIPGDIPENLLALMGISVSVTPVSAYLSKKKYGEAAKPSEELSAEKIRKEAKEKRWETMLLENNRPGLTRFQMFSWTVLSIFLYLALFFATLNEFAMNNIENLFLPDIDFTMVMLMGLSQGAYIGGKWVAPTRTKILSIGPEKARGGTIATIRGVNFGLDTDTVLVGNMTIKREDITMWDESRIDFKVPNIETDEYKVKVLVGTKEAATKLKIEKADDIPSGSG